MPECDPITFKEAVKSLDADTPGGAAEGVADLPTEFEAWWGASRYHNLNLIGYSDKKCLAWAAFQATRTETDRLVAEAVAREREALRSLTAVVAASGGRVAVPLGIAVDLPFYELRRHEGVATGAMVFQAIRAQGDA